MKYTIMGIRLGLRSESSAAVQAILSKNGHCIKVRLGLHETGDAGGEEGLMILQLCGADAEIQALASELCGLENVTAKLLTL